MRPQKIHLIGICGTAMASLAGMLKGRGFEVRGSDAAAYPPMSDFLDSLGISVMQPFSEENFAWQPDLVVVGNAISRGNVELEHVLDRRLRFTSMAQLVYDEFIQRHQSLVVAGTHGKTTTTSMLAWIFQVAGREPSFLIGGIAENFGSSFAVTNGCEFIIEGDEYDTCFFDKGPKFWHYFPDAVALTSVEFDHADIYRDLEAVKWAFKRLVNLVPKRGVIVAWDGNENVSECVERALCKVERFGFAEASDWRIVDLQHQPDLTQWKVLRNGAPWAQFEFSLAGDYNVLNATAAAGIAANYGIAPEVIANALATFKSVKRRLEVKAEVDGITIIDDFAHHPTAIAATLNALRSRYNGRRLVAVLEPRSNTLRRNIFQHELVRSLAKADEVVLASVFFKTTDSLSPEERLDVDAVIKDLIRRGVPARQLANADEIAAALGPELRSGDVVALLSNGGFGAIYEKLPQSIRAHRER
ncbi:MAG TPA: UDP-N-acetylmuramate:L-alanyl-gamma-D-glutamyl-meso-diaminopimelate ligase [candidate division Zixibacteria bacterium]|nr:UDP-N-acetylmuramate:L-alanyl-gamma-D-glutamyl-meso-diaminopimelate ligase [candidate division Zixibacteria bacterium]